MDGSFDHARAKAHTKIPELWEDLPLPPGKGPTYSSRQKVSKAGKGDANEFVGTHPLGRPGRDAVSNVLHKLQVADRKEAAVRVREAGLGQDKP